jgi:hypothetical protein
VTASRASTKDIRSPGRDAARSSNSATVGRRPSRGGFWSANSDGLIPAAAARRNSAWTSSGTSRTRGTLDTGTGYSDVHACSPKVGSTICSAAASRDWTAARQTEHRARSSSPGRSEALSISPRRRGSDRGRRGDRLRRSYRASGTAEALLPGPPVPVEDPPLRGLTREAGGGLGPIGNCTSRGSGHWAPRSNSAARCLAMRGSRTSTRPEVKLR